MTAAEISFEEVEVGDKLPELAIDITPSTVVSAASTTGRKRDTAACTVAS